MPKEPENPTPLGKLLKWRSARIGSVAERPGARFQTGRNVAGNALGFLFCRSHPLAFGATAVRVLGFTVLAADRLEFITTAYELVQYGRRYFGQINPI